MKFLLRLENVCGTFALWLPMLSMVSLKMEYQEAFSMLAMNFLLERTINFEVGGEAERNEFCAWSKKERNQWR
jgi:hypothetical protein